MTKMPQKLFFSENIKSYRKSKKFTQQELADKLYISLKTYQNWENRKACPEIDDAYAVCEILDCDIDYLFGRQSLPRKRYSSIHDETGLSQNAIEKIFFLKETYGYTEILSAIIDSSNFTESLHAIFSALWCKKSASERVTDNWAKKEHPWLKDIPYLCKSHADDIAKETLRVFSRYSSEFVIVPRKAQIASYIQTAKDSYGEAIKDALSYLEDQKIMDEKLLHLAEIELHELVNSDKEKYE